MGVGIMAFSFPPNPAVGDAYAAGGNSWFWNSVLWERGTGLVKPFLTQLVPNEGPTNDPSIAVRVLGGNFKADSKVFWDVAEMPTTFVSSTELNVTALSAPLASIANVTVSQDAGLMASGPLEFTYIQPAPFITALEPNVSPTNVATTVKIIGGNFTSNSIVVFDGVVYDNPTFVNAGELSVVAPVRTAAKSVVVVVADGVLNSNNVPFNYLLQTMWLTAIQPNRVKYNASQTTVHFIGSGFVAALRIIMGPVDVSPVNFHNAGDLSTIIFPEFWNMGAPATPGQIMCYLWNGQTGEVTNSLPFTFDP